MGIQTKKKFSILLTFCFVILLTATALGNGQSTYQDLEWLKSAKSNLATLKNDNAGLVDASSHKDWSNISLYGKAKYIDSQKALVASKSFSVSPSYQPDKNEYEAFLSDCSQSGYYAEKAAAEAQKGETEKAYNDLITATSYATSEYTHLINFGKLLSADKHPFGM